MKFLSRLHSTSPAPARARRTLEIAPAPLSRRRSSSSGAPATQVAREPRQEALPKRLFSLLRRHGGSRRVTLQVHGWVIASGLLFKDRSSSSTATLLFNALLRCYALDRLPLEAILLYKHSQSGILSASSSVSFNSFTYTFLLNSCVGLGCTVPGVQLHGLTLKLGFESHVYVQTALVYMYVACGSVGEGGKVFDSMPERNPVSWNVLISGLTKWGRLDLARSLFEEMPVRTVVSWTAIIDGYTRMNQPSEAIHLFRKMVKDDGITPSEITMLTIFPAIANMGSVKVCKSAHCYAEKRGFNSSDIRVSNSLIDLYSKCGCIMSASKFFEEIMDARKNLVSWTSIISAFAMHGMGEEAAQNFGRMEIGGLKPNQVTFLSILNAFSHGGFVEEGLRFFEKMVNVYQLVPDVKHYGSLVDMLGRAGRLKEAEKVALEVPREIANVVIWRTLLGACSFHGDVEMAERATKRILEMERGYGGDYVLMSNVFAGAGRFNDAERLRQLMDQTTASKVPGQSLV
ncbi:pentatricopeptide repeat-containing protein At1g09220, mitochondrial [Rhodamnia argentea]|uniref:Pentatricopeptide repeat-containing protein At1g09220, mitochondrial n=1 Tax=Rhodamnia argentea TaxID=178133 RepID=A0ABM3GSV2_9MYRT|nr:pentatricopeptide repeat-containing protein At1g09220, mitochondrial [Rhodamnia argentea]XP_048127430.1 pentatricopeptide repeat-containing protein At1g09220, mitochondrial [Rhodamnia argentea]XP_048127434.1 pentatricopeptide repeat-containing protein At1g09220, mitochondrial [Rhodamnia argentea]XP_048127436.1 pentatricopeptide repeat-containing protein At1g09220, mitochondrial [Rhodamnia argentea]XP_048127439.1 pentatricopeptide repeat-containing protein At1g09220, mitochondrial [Rhodamnia 